MRDYLERNWVVFAVIVLSFFLTWQCAITRQNEQDKFDALHAYALKTKGHLERYQTDWRIVYLDGRNTYYPEYQGEWVTELVRIRQERTISGAGNYTEER